MANPGRRGEKIALPLCGHCHFDSGVHEHFRNGELADFELPDEQIDQSLAAVPTVE